MQARSFPVLVAVTALFGSLTVARADDAQVRKAIQANYDKIATAFRDSKPEVMDSLLAKDATLTTPDHKTWNRDRIVSDFKRQSAMMKNATWNRKITAVKVHGEEAVATVKGKFHGTFPGQGGTSHIFDLDSLTVDTWVRSGGAWKLKHADTRELKAKIDGKGMPEGAGGR
jgi:hypothetical protein